MFRRLSRDSEMPRYVASRLVQWRSVKSVRSLAVVPQTTCQRSDGERAKPVTSLPDYLEPGLDIVLVGINPGAYSVRVGHYYARPGNRFWNAANRAGLFDEPFGPETDARVLEFGIGLTDVVKRPTPSAKVLRAADYRRWAPVLKSKIRRFRPRIVCFQGIDGYRNYLRYGEGLPGRRA